MMRPRRPRLALTAAGCVLLLSLTAPGARAQKATAADTALPRRIQLGATLAEVPDSLRSRGLPAGALVLSVVPASPAATAGVQSNDIITLIGRDTVASVANALAALRPMPAGRSVAIRVVRGATPVSLTFSTRERPRETSTEFAIEYRAVQAHDGKHRVLVTHPADNKRHPAVLLIGGIGCYTIDTPVGPSSYRDLLYHLTRRGYTTVRVEKLGIGDSEGGPCIDASFETEVDGYRQALSALRNYPSVDSANVFLLGHSIGGIEAPLLAGERGAAVRGVAVLSTTGIAWYEYELANLRRQLELQDYPPDSVERTMRLKTECGYHFLIEKQSRESIVAKAPACADHLPYPASDAYMHSVADAAPASLWRLLDVPGLVMWGTADFVTSRAEHLQLVDAINAMHPGRAKYADVAELDHYMSHQASQVASLRDPVSGLNRPYFGTTLEPVLDSWLDSLSRRN